MRIVTQNFVFIAINMLRWDGTQNKIVKLQTKPSYVNHRYPSTDKHWNTTNENTHVYVFLCHITNHILWKQINMKNW